MNRREFVELSTRIIGGLSIPGVLGGFTSAADTGVRKNSALDDSYLEKGLIGMARAKGWFYAHWGAAVLAGYYLCKENCLDEQTATAVKKQLDALIRLRAAQFAPLPEEPANERLIAKVAVALCPAIQGGLRAHGHAVIFASLSTRALRDAPQMAQPALIESLCGLSSQIARKEPEKPAHEAAAYADTQAMIEATFDSLVRFKDLLGRHSIRRPNFTHMVTHTEALMNLAMMGYQDLARTGYAGHRVHIGAPVPKFDSEIHADGGRATLEAVMSENYWENEQNLDRWNREWNETDNPNGYWVAFGHLFKVLYSYHRLIRRVDDEEKVRLCSMILLERYLNPNVQGG